MPHTNKKLVKPSILPMQITITISPDVLAAFTRAESEAQNRNRLLAAKKQAAGLVKDAPDNDSDHGKACCVMM